MEGIEIGHAAAKRAGDHANDVHEMWYTTADFLLRDYAVAHQSFRCEEFRAWARGRLPAPPDTRAFGQVMRRGAAAGVVRNGGYVRARSHSVHGMHVTLWVSLLYRVV